MDKVQVIPKVVLDHMGGSELYPEVIFMRNPQEIRDRAVEDAEYLLAVNFSGYEDYPQPVTANACRNFIKRSSKITFMTSI